MPTKGKTKKRKAKTGDKDLAKLVTKLEDGKVNLTIAQVAEVIRILRALGKIK